MTSPGLWLHQLNQHMDENARREILASAALGFFRILLQQAFVKIAKLVALFGIPIQIINCGDDGRQILRLANEGRRIVKNRLHHARMSALRVAQLGEGFAIEPQFLQRFRLGQSLPAIFLGDVAPLPGLALPSS